MMVEDFVICIASNLVHSWCTLLLDCTPLSGSILRNFCLQGPAHIVAFQNAGRNQLQRLFGFALTADRTCAMSETTQRWTRRRVWSQAPVPLRSNSV